MLVTLVIVVVVGMRNMYLVSGTFVVLGGLGLFFIPKNPRLVRQQGFVFKRRYWLYYLLNFLDGCRAEISMTFALFTLVDIYHVDVQHTTLLLLINAVLGWFAAPRIGALVDRIGERPVLTVAYATNAAVFLDLCLRAQRRAAHAHVQRLLGGRPGHDRTQHLPEEDRRPC